MYRTRLDSDFPKPSFANEHLFIIKPGSIIMKSTPTLSIRSLAITSSSLDGLIHFSTPLASLSSDMRAKLIKI